MNNIKLEKIDKNNIDYKLIYSWCIKPFVYKWFEQRILSIDEIINKYSNKLDSEQELFYINHLNKRIGLVQIYESIYKNKKVNEFDLYIGEEEYLNKGLGKNIITIINNYIDNNYKNKSTILRPFKKNIIACNCYLKSGYKWLEDYDGLDTLNNKEIISVYIRKSDNNGN